MALGRSRRGGGISVREMWEELREIRWLGVFGECGFVASFEDLEDGLCFKSSVGYSKFSRCVCLRGGMGGWLFSAVEFLKHVQGLVQIFAILCLFRVTSFHGSTACAFARVRIVFRRSSLENVMGKIPFFPPGIILCEIISHMCSIFRKCFARVPIPLGLSQSRLRGSSSQVAQKMAVTWRTIRLALVEACRLHNGKQILVHHHPV